MYFVRMATPPARLSRNQERYRELMEDEPELFNRVPLKMIASMMGFAPETLNRLRGKLNWGDPAVLPKRLGSAGDI